MQVALKRIAQGSKALLRSSLTTRPSASISYVEDTTGLEEDQVQIYQTALDFSRENIAPHAAAWDREGFFPQDVMRQAAALGFGAIYTTSEFGGSEMGRLEASLIFEALSTGCASTAAFMSIHNMCTWIVDTFGSQQQRERWIPQMVHMDKFSSYCLTEPNSGSDSAAMQTTAKEQGDSYVLNGSKCFISGGSVSDIYIVMAKTGEKEISCFLVEKGTPGLSFGKLEEKMGWKNQPTSMVMFEDCKIPKENLIGTKGSGFKIAMQGLDGGRINIASCSLGGAAFCLDTARDYVKSRKQFGKPLSDFQNIQFKLADMATDLVASRLMVRNAARMIDSQHPEKTMFSAMAKRYATDSCFDIVNYALQMHGGYGYLNDYPIERFLRDLRVHQILEGTNEVMRMIVSRRILKD